MSRDTVEAQSGDRRARNRIAACIDVLFLAFVFLAPGLIPLIKHHGVMSLPEWTAAMSWSNGRPNYLVQYMLLPIGVSLTLLSAVLATYHISVMRRCVHVLSFGILFELFYRFAYGGPVSTGVLLSVSETSHRESWELIAGHPALSILLTLLAVIGFYALVVSWNARHRFLTALLPLVSAAALVNVLCISIVIHELGVNASAIHLISKELAGAFPIDIIGAVQAVASSKWDSRRNAPARIAFKFPNARMVDISARSASREIYVIVIGETSRRRNWSLFGYTRDTTPRLRELRSELFTFDRVTANATNTIQSLPLALSRADAGNPNRFHSERSIVSLLSQAGFETSWISNQERSQSPDNPVMQIALEADNASFPDAVEQRAGSDSFDSNLLGRLDAQLSRSSNTSKTVIFLHMEGSHFSYQDRYPAEAAQFHDADAPPRPLSKHQARVVNEYDNTIHFTDHNLQKIIARLQQCGCVSGLLFFSDHGERLFDHGLADDDFGHGYPTVAPTEIEVPFFIYLSDAYRLRNPRLVENLMRNAHAVAQLHNVFETIVDLSGITFDGRSSDLSLFSENFAEPASLSVLDMNENVISLPVPEYPPLYQPAR